jgi:hypothetical protein
MPRIPIGPWSPDLPDLENPGSLEALNVIPAAKSYRPLPSFASVSNALTARAQGAIFVRKSDGTGTIFGGDATKLYQLSMGTFSDVSRISGGAYSCPAEGIWSLVQFGSLIYAFNGIDAPQQLNMDGDSNFSNMTGSPPAAKYACVAGDFVMTGNQSGFTNRLQWGPINQNGVWTPSQVTQADSQDLPDGGHIQGLVGIQQAAVVFQEFAVRLVTYIGAPLVFQVTKLSDQLGATIRGSIASYRDLIFFCDNSGFQMLVGAQQFTPIGEQRVNRWFWRNIDQSNLARVTSAIDPINGLYAIAFPDSSATNGNPNHILIYCWSLDRWAHIQPGDLDMIYSAAMQSGWTLEQLDQFGTVEQVPFSLDSAVWAGIANRLIGGFDTTHKLGFFNGANLAATVDTTEAAPGNGRLVRIRSTRPLVDGGTPSIALGTRNMLMDPVAWGSAVAANSNGSCPLHTAARYIRGRITMPAGQSWTHMLGIDDLDFRPEGRQ